MRFPNPTPLKIGTAGRLLDRQYRVVGRVVMSMKEDGETYYWNEFHLVDQNGESASLVFEETESGGEWKLFVLFEPTQALTASEAAAKQLGDPVNLDGTAARVTLVDQSRVCFVEGTPPEGVEVGDVAQYFNVDQGNRMYVVSWTGDEVECYRGIDLPAARVAAAFGLPAAATRFSSGGPGAAKTGASFYAGLGGALAIAAWLFFTFGTCRITRSTAAPIKPKTPAAPLAIGQSGVLAGRHWNITGHAVIEVGKVGAVFDRHEYRLAGDNDETSLLVCGLAPDSSDWALFKPAQAGASIAPRDAAARHIGELLVVGDRSVRIEELFQLKPLSTQGLVAPQYTSGVTVYALRGTAAATPVMLQWTEAGTTVLDGHVIPKTEILTAFKAR